MNKKLNYLELAISSLSDKNPKQMRTLRNQLNNRISSFQDELKFGKKLPNISESHALFGLNLKECQELLEASKRELKKRINDE